MAALDQKFINNRALHLMLQIPTFTGFPGTRFDNWVRHLDNVLAPTNWPDAEKIRALTDKLQDSAYDILQSVRADGDSYEQLKEKLKKRYHGHETGAYYQREFENRVRKPGETIADFAYDLRRILDKAYTQFNTDQLRYPLLQRAFLKGISPKLRLALANTEFTDYENLVTKAITIDAQHAAEYDEATAAPAAFIKAVDADNMLMRRLEELTESVAALTVTKDENATFDNKRRKIRCGFCGKIGHTHERCFDLHPEFKRVNSKGRTQCPFCKSTEHFGKNCRRNSANQQPNFMMSQGN